MRLMAEIDRRVAGNVSGGCCFGTRLVNILEAVQAATLNLFLKPPELGIRSKILAISEDGLRGEISRAGI
ncbi:uncharacterized protein BKA55DRAFT_586183 [Fusarium redolens]|jgi:hypothetical protein|uniref:Uncharacterized protein n=1 Tax=Fusarium redolens TaxID=48865 RepID=A0A9P9JKK0_FUSRE|nr:uncharacterized protein BKA55DRAFT_586183 [Fusarium redolens]KAH7208478.1 hypothetical protein BKA55DRAFT_586183 [Fusarium redolens]